MDKSFHCTLYWVLLLINVGINVKVAPWSVIWILGHIPTLRLHRDLSSFLMEAKGIFIVHVSNNMDSFDLIPHVSMHVISNRVIFYIITIMSGLNTRMSTLKTNNTRVPKQKQIITHFRFGRVQQAFVICRRGIQRMICIVSGPFYFTVQTGDRWIPPPKNEKCVAVWPNHMRLSHH